MVLEFFFKGRECYCTLQYEKYLFGKGSKMLFLLVNIAAYLHCTVILDQESYYWYESIEHYYFSYESLCKHPS